MRRMPHIWSLLFLLAFLGPPPRASNAEGESPAIRLGDRYHGDHLRFRGRPRRAGVPGSRVTYVKGSERDVYRYGRFYYGYDGGRWYRSSTYQGPWYHVRGRIVPRAVYSVPADYRKDWRGDYNYWSTRDYDPDWERYQGNGTDRNRDRSPASHERNMTN
jgi:hypothetical protein